AGDGALVGRAGEQGARGGSSRRGHGDAVPYARRRYWRMTASAERRSTERPEKETRHRAREAAVQMLYQWEVGRVSIIEVGELFWTHGPAATEPISDALRTFATALATGVA